MKKALLILAAAFIFGGAQVTNAQDQYSMNDNPDVQSVTLGINKSKKLFDRKIIVKVLTVVEDSRCPTNVNCIQAGNAKVRISLQKGTNPSKTVELNTNGDNTATIDGYSVKLQFLTPSPKTAAPIRPKDYAATISVERSASTAKK